MFHIFHDQSRSLFTLDAMLSLLEDRSTLPHLRLLDRVDKMSAMGKFDYCGRKTNEEG